MELKLRKFREFTPGKVIISGEHSVLYKMPAVACTVDWGILAEIFKGKMSRELLESNYFQKIVKMFEEKFKKRIDLQKICIKITSNLPQKSGLGSSAAFATSVFKVLLAWFGIKISQEELINLVWRAESFVHGSSSGVDPTAVVLRGLLKFKKRSLKRGMSYGFAHEQILSDFNFKKHFSLVNSGKAKESTGEMVGLVARRLNSGVFSQEILEKMSEVTQKIIYKLKNKQNMVEEIKENHKLLVELGVVGEKAQKIISKIERNGGAAKITGAGGIKGGSGYILQV